MTRLYELIRLEGPLFLKQLVDAKIVNVNMEVFYKQFHVVFNENLRTELQDFCPMKA